MLIAPSESFSKKLVFSEVAAIKNYWRALSPRPLRGRQMAGMREREERGIYAKF
jgi:hypothetical protein